METQAGETCLRFLNGAQESGLSIWTYGNRAFKHCRRVRRRLIQARRQDDYESIQRFAQPSHGKRLFHHVEQSDMLRPRPVEKVISIIFSKVANKHDLIEVPCPAHRLQTKKLVTFGSKIIV